MTATRKRALQTDVMIFVSPGVGDGVPPSGRITIYQRDGITRVEATGHVKVEGDPGVDGGFIAECACLRMAGTGLSNEEACRDLERVFEAYLGELLKCGDIGRALRAARWRDKLGSDDWQEIDLATRARTTPSGPVISVELVEPVAEPQEQPAGVGA